MIILEKFVNPDLKEKVPQETLEQLVLSVGVPELNNITAADFYKQAVQNLKKYAPNLKVVRLDGGYAYYPKTVDNDTIKNEIIFFHDNLDAVLKTFGDAGIIVHSIKLKVYWLSSKKVSSLIQIFNYLQLVTIFRKLKSMDIRH